MIRTYFPCIPETGCSFSVHIFTFSPAFMDVRTPWSISRNTQPMICPAFRYFITFAIFWEASGSFLLMFGVFCCQLIHKPGSCITIPPVDFLSCGNNIAVYLLFWPNLDCKYRICVCVKRFRIQLLYCWCMCSTGDKSGMFPLVHCWRWQRGTCCDSVKEKLQNMISAEDTRAFTKATVKLNNLSMYLLKHL